ncbi:MAG TPA: FAD-dependent oxidoreductase [Myxococcota bacterium]
MPVVTARADVAAARPLSIAVIGAGVAGAACARGLLEAGHDVRVFDKGRGPGGRCSTRSADNDRRFDHGAPCFTVADDGFARLVEGWRAEGLVVRWTPRMASTSSSSSSSSSSRAQADRWIAQPAMSALLHRMLVGVPVTFNAPVVQIARAASDDDRFVCIGAAAEPLGTFDAVVVAVPAPQAATLLTEVAPALAAQARTAVMRATWALLLDYDGAGPDVDFDVAEVRGRPLRFAAREASKPGRRAGARWVLHGTAVDDNDPAGATVPPLRTDDTAARASEVLLAEFVALAGNTAAHPSLQQAHLWRYAFVERPVGRDCLVSDDARVIACGDWCVGPRVEAAYLSGMAAARRLLSSSSS